MADALPLSRLHVASSDEVARVVADEIATGIDESRSIGQTFALGLAAGSTPIEVYAELVRRHREERLSFANVLAIGLDEYLGLPRSHPETFRQFFTAHLLAHVDLPRKNIRLLDSETEEAKVDSHVDDFERAILDCGGLDLLLLGIGINGHIGFNEPGSRLDSRTRRVELHPKTREKAASAFGALDAVPQHALTMGVGTILEAQRLRVLAFGASKRDILERVIATGPTPELPATLVRGHADVRFYADPEAAGAESTPR